MIDQYDITDCATKIIHRWGAWIMTQGLLPFHYEVEKKPGGMTAFAGLPTYLEFGYLMGLAQAMGKRLKIRCGDQGWSDFDGITILIDAGRVLRFQGAVSGCGKRHSTLSRQGEQAHSEQRIPAILSPAG